MAFLISNNNIKIVLFSRFILYFLIQYLKKILLTKIATACQSRLNHLNPLIFFVLLFYVSCTLLGNPLHQKDMIKSS